MKHLKVILTLLFVLSIIVVSMVWHLAKLQSELIESDALRTAKIYSRALDEFRAVYTSEVVSRVSKHGIEVTHDYLMRDNAIPLPATLSMMLGEKIGKRNLGARSQLYSPYSFPWRKNREKPPFFDFNAKAWDVISTKLNTEYFQFSQQDNEPVLLYARADVMKSECVACHNTHPDSPKTDWKVGDIRGVLVVTCQWVPSFLKLILI